MGQKLVRKFKQQPLVPLGTLMTCGALYLSARAIKQGDSRMANHMFRWRVGLQAFTVIAIIGGAYMYRQDQINRPSEEELMRQKAKERERLWIQELERIDNEAKERQERAKNIQEAFLKRREEAHAEDAAKRAARGQAPKDVKGE